MNAAGYELGTEQVPAYRLSVVTLGRFVASIAGAEIPSERWGRPKVQTLFKYLMTAPQHRAHREVVMQALWPELPIEAARSNLNSTLYRLRRVLEPDLMPRQRSRFVATGASVGLIFTPEDHWDVTEFLARALAAHDSRRDEDFAAAAALYVGDYLPDDLYDDWALQMREHLSGEYERLLLYWGQILSDRGPFDRAVDVMELLLRHNPTLEVAHRLLMWLYARAGWREQALRQYRRCQTLLQHYWGIDPDATTQDLYRRILDDGTVTFNKR